MPSDIGIAIDSATQRWYVNWTGSQVPYVTAGFPSPIVTSPLYRDGLVPPVTSYPVGPPLGTASAVFAPGACLMSPGVIELIARGSFSIRFTTPPPGLA
jgi:hypothetical protein